MALRPKIYFQNARVTPFYTQKTPSPSRSQGFAPREQAFLIQNVGAM